MNLSVADELVDFLYLLIEWEAKFMLGIEFQALADLFEGVSCVSKFVEKF
jgi:hypothetical protein